MNYFFAYLRQDGQDMPFFSPKFNTTPIDSQNGRMRQVLHIPASHMEAADGQESYSF